MSSKESDGIQESYQETWKKYQSGPKALMWNSYTSSAQHYKHLVKDLDFSNSSILDVGCGFGSLIPYIAAKADNFTYLGLDIVPEFIKNAETTYPDYKFAVRDYFSDPLPDMFDIILACGVMNRNRDDVHEFRKQAIKTMFDHANKAIAFNMVGGRDVSNVAGKLVHYADPMEILEYAMTLSPKVIYKQDYHPKNFTIVILK